MADDRDASSKNAPSTGNVSIERDANGNIIVTGNNNQIIVIQFVIQAPGGGEGTSASAQPLLRSWGLPGGEEKLVTAVLKDWVQLMGKLIPHIPLDGIGPRLLQKLVENYIHYQEQPYPAADENFGELFDREPKMKEIRDLFPSTHLVELLGPSGIGKTHMLNAMMQEVDHQRGATFAGHWCYLYANARREGHYNALIRKIIGDCGQQINAGVRPEDLAMPLANCLAGQIAQKHTDHFLFIIDDADALSPADLGLLIGNDGPVGERVRTLLHAYRNIVLHLILVAHRRCLSQAMMKQHNRYLLRRIFIEPLDERYVREMLAARFQSHAHVEMDELAASQGGAAIFALTGGHPGAVKFILDRLVQENFVLPVEMYPAHFREDVVKMIQGQTTRDLSLGEYLVLNVLGALRRFDNNLVCKLIEGGILPDDVIGVKANGDLLRLSNGVTRWLNMLSETTGLVLNENNVYRVHPVLCQVLPMDLQRHNRELLEGLYSQVFEIYHNDYLVHKDESLPLQFILPSRLRVSLDALYYALRIGKPSSEILQLAREYQKLYCQAINLSKFPGDFDDMSLAWNEDTALRELAAQHKIFEALDDILRQSVFPEE